LSAALKALPINPGNKKSAESVRTSGTNTKPTNLKGTKHMSDYISHDHEHDGIDRRGFLKCMAWAGTGVLWTVSGGVLASKTLAQIAKAGSSLPKATDLSFLQISDSHIGFNKDANKNVTETFKIALDRINAMPAPPSFLIHTGDITQLSKPEEFDTFDEVLKSCRTRDVFHVPGEHDVLNDGGKLYRERYLKNVEAKGSGWYSFNKNGVHFIGLVNVLDLQAGGLGQLGEEQLAWLEGDVKGLGADTPIVVFAHIPLWAVYPQWGWGTSDSERALGYLKRFGSVTVLNGHIHQVLQKIEGNVTFHTAMSTAFPQPYPGTAPSPGPMKVPAEKLRSLLGLTNVEYKQGRTALAIIDSNLS
jgi:3',5'-cyclic-AMP phosphodiesterase